MKAKFVYESIGDVLKPKSEEDILSSMENLKPLQLLMQSSEKGFLPGVKKALKRGVDIHYGNEYALRWALEYGHYDVVEFLLKHGADVHAIDDWALRCASEKGYKDIIKLLKKYEKEENITESLSDLFKPKSEEEILQDMKKIPSMYVERLNKGAKAKPSSYPLIVKIFKKALNNGYPVSNLQSKREGSYKRAEFRILAKDKKYEEEDLRFIIDFRQSDHEDFIKIIKFDTWMRNTSTYLNEIYTFEDFEEFIKNVILKEMIPVHVSFDNGKRILTNYSRI